MFAFVIRDPSYNGMFNLVAIALVVLYLFVRNMINKYRTAARHGATKLEAFLFVIFNSVMVLTIVNGLLILPFPISVLQAVIGVVLLRDCNIICLRRFVLRALNQQPPSTS